MSEQNSVTARRPEMDRAMLSAFGALGGLALWFLFERFTTGGVSERLILSAALFVLTYFGAGLAMFGHMPMRRALGLSALVALIPALLMGWASYRFDEVGSFLETGHVIVAAFVLSTLPVPFLIARERGTIWEYEQLFLGAWSIVVRFSAAGLFMGVIWGVMGLSAMLLDLVDVTIISDILEYDPMPYVVTGATLGLGIAIVDELQEYVSPYLILRLLRVLVPPVLLVVLVFLAALPFRGLSQLFGALSAGGILMGIAIGAITLIAIVVDTSDAEMGRSRIVQRSAQALALCLPLLGGLAGYAVWLRVGQYGFTPSRVAAAVTAVIVLGYALTYTGAVLRGQGWAGRIRRGNIAMALVMVAVAALWLTPVLNVEAIATRSQVARFNSGASTVAQLPLREMRWDWGRAGSAGLARLATIKDHAEQAELERKLAQTAAMASRWSRDVPSDDPVELERQFLALVTVLPEGAALPPAEGRETHESQYHGWVEACERRDTKGRPGCVILVADLLPDLPGDEAILFQRGDRSVWQQEFRSHSASGQAYRMLPAGKREADPEAFFDDLYAGRFTIKPVALNAFHVGDADFIVLP